MEKTEAKAFMKRLRNGETPVCPECGKGVVSTDRNPKTSSFFSCDNCSFMVHIDPMPLDRFRSGRSLKDSRDKRIDGEYDRPLPERTANPTKEDLDRLQWLIKKYDKNKKESKIEIQEKFNTSMGLVFRVANDRVFKINQILETEGGQYIIQNILFSANPDDNEFVNLIVEHYTPQ